MEIATVRAKLQKIHFKLIEVNGKPMLNHILDWAESQGVEALTNLDILPINLKIPMVISLTFH